ncbi:MAG TPA: Gfo/Idh/MocA family oxidoreductase [Firmicutes bacterium]|nr:Gfo/Idh/MocA family oxidoreductase [Bacillota bacterium]
MINVAIVGCGNWGKNYVRNFREIPDARLLVCCDKDEARLKAIKERYPFVRVTRNFNEVANNPKVDAVVIATPPVTHYPIARTCLLRGKHVLIEKPFTVSTEEADQLVNLAEKGKRVLMVGHILDYHPALRQLKEYIQSGELGRIYYIYANRTSLGIVRDDVSVMWDKAPHDIASLLYLLDDEPVYVAAKGQAFINSGIEDVIFMTLKFRNDIIANIHVSWLDPCKVSKTTIIGEKKMVVFDDAEALEKIRIYNKGVNRKNGNGNGNGNENGLAGAVNGNYSNGNGVHPDGLNGFPEFQYTYSYGDVYIPKIKMSEPLKNQCLHFLECIREQKRPMTDGINGLTVVKVLERAEDSLRSNGEYVAIEGTGYGLHSMQKASFVARARSLWRGFRLEKIF